MAKIAWWLLLGLICASVASLMSVIARADPLSGETAYITGDEYKG